MNLTDIPQLRQPPTAMESEQVIIGALLLDKTGVRPHQRQAAGRSFFRHENRLIYAEIERQLAAGKGVDLVTVHQALADEQISLVYLNDVAQYVPSLTNVGRHADLIVAAARARSLMIACDEISLLAQDQGAASMSVGRGPAEARRCPRKRRATSGWTRTTAWSCTRRCWKTGLKVGCIHGRPACMTWTST